MPQLIQVIVNLLQNAAKFTPEGGKLAVSVETRDGEVVVNVHDSGTGIEPSLLPHVFELFTEGKRSADRSQGGLGLGHALVNSLVNLHGRRVSAQSQGCGMGSTSTSSQPRVIFDFASA